MIIGKTLEIRKSKNVLLINRDINLDNLFLDNYAICSDCTQINDIDSAYNEESPGFYYRRFYFRPN